MILKAKSKGKVVKLADLEAGTLFLFEDRCIAVKSEYTTEKGLIECTIVGSGEMFWGGAKTTKQQNALLVQPLEIEMEKTGMWIETVKPADGLFGLYQPYHHCSECGYEHIGSAEYGGYYCDNCGVRMKNGGARRK